MMELLPIFVYGTLKRGQCREKYWPRAPLSVETAFTRGRLYDLGPYPAMTAGHDLIRGELWHLRPEDLGATLETLDSIEGCVDGTGDQYIRVVIDCLDETGRRQRAYAYHFAQLEKIGRFPVVAVRPSGYCEWTP
jgi:gamma-glutamylcyclotransferase (GGCT)/AIG2-like uncharacterized protein YtfP